MALDETVDLVDAPLLLDSLADSISLVDQAHPDEDIPEEREQVISACRRAAKLVAGVSGSSQSYAEAQRYGGQEIRNAVLRSLFGIDGAAELLDL